MSERLPLGQVGKREESSCFDNIRATGPGVSAPLVVPWMLCHFNKGSLNTIEGDIQVIGGLFDLILAQGPVDTITEHSPTSVPASTNGSNDKGSNGAEASTERPPSVSHQGDSGAQPVVNGLS